MTLPLPKPFIKLEIKNSKFTCCENPSVDIDSTTNPSPIFEEDVIKRLGCIPRMQPRSRSHQRSTSPSCLRRCLSSCLSSCCFSHKVNDVVLEEEDEQYVKKTRHSNVLSDETKTRAVKITPIKKIKDHWNYVPPSEKLKRRIYNQSSSGQSPSAPKGLEKHLLHTT